MVSHKHRINARKQPWEIDVPAFDSKNYDNSISKNLNFYKTALDSKVAREFTISYWKEQGKPVEFFDKVATGYFVTAGGLVLLIRRSIQLNEKNLSYLDETYNKIVELAEQAKEKHKEQEIKREESGVKVKTLQERNDELSRNILADLDGEYDEVLMGHDTFNVKKWFIQKRLNSQVCQKISEFYQKRMSELDEVIEGKDEQLNEGYSCYSKRIIRLMKEFVSEVISACGVVAASKIKLPRARKEKPPAMLVQNLKYLKEIPELVLKSITPDKMVGASEVWVFNQKYRRINVYKAMDGMTITVKGQTLLNWNPEKSGNKIVRKPEEFFKEFPKMTKKNMMAIYDGIKGITGTVNGRLNNDTLIIQCF